MDRIIFKKEIDRLYEKLYSINEGLSSNESREFVKGFNDGIKEGFKLLNDINEWNPFKAAATAAGKVGGAVKGAYQQGAKLAGQVWSTVADFASATYNKIKTGVETAAQWVKTQPGKIKTYLEGIYKQAVTDMTSAYETLKDKAAELSAAIGKIWTDITTTITTAVTNVKASLAKTEDEAKAWFETNKQVLLDQASALAESTKDWLKEMGTIATDVATKVANGTLTALKGIGVAAVIIIAAPIWLLYKGVVAVPALYKATQTQADAAMSTLGTWWSQQKQEMGEAYAAGWNKGMAATGVPSGKIPVRNPTTGRMEAAPTEGFIMKFDTFVNEKKGMSKAAFLEMIGKGKKGKGKKEEGDKKEKCTTCGKGKKCKCD
jgi:hypothetical protein